MAIAHFEHKGWKFEGISEGGIRTSIAFPSLDLLFDFGAVNPDKINIGNLLLTHAHLDHSAGIPYYVSQRSLRQLPPPRIFVPKAIEENLRQILKLYSVMEDFDYDYHLQGVEWGERVDLKPGFFFKPLPSFHRVPSQGYTIFESRKKLKKEFSHLSQTEIREMKEKNADPTTEIQTPLVSFSGDSKIEYVLENDDVRKSQILFMECTYYCDKRGVERAREWGHTHLDEIVQNADAFENESIVLIHASKRYRYKELIEIVDKKIPDSLKDRIHLFIPVKP
ncbi:MBL fold metallo-hydrolase [Leptospira idonii]|uniref:MBL fold metallo-hydrolase n=1 Tax=Leptospira idonii TaxID=1193500 RepID=A0A4R9M1Z4_9LEPT|nr:MBL fold metallo-hydrolase [Leptospira idonii]TGN20112.1 MBL fold metallo-hydrolase [Leptospira idonii]